MNCSGGRVQGVLISRSMLLGGSSHGHHSDGDCLIVDAGVARWNSGEIRGQWNEGMIDETFSYATCHTLSDALGNSAKQLQGNACCRVRINGKTVVATELPDNPGMSLTNAASFVAMQVCQFYEIPLDELIWIEHYPTQLGREETFDRVLFNNIDGILCINKWLPLSTHEATQLFGAALV